MKKKAYVVEEQLFVLIHNYLLTRPMQEIESIVNGLRNCKSCDVEVKDEIKNELEEKSKNEK